ncbi:MAG: hypothetical protein IT293_05485 [Deltaproteobacteria bacterium]|nr:hypothetical protein [Deltaproteobacteria bacterium]
MTAPRHALRLLAALAGLGCTLLGAPPSAAALSPPTSITESFSATVDNAGDCEGGPELLRSHPVQAGDVVRITARISGFDPNLPPDTPLGDAVFAGVTADFSSSDPSNTTTGVVAADEVADLTVCIGVGTHVTVTVEINPTGRLVNAVALLATPLVRDCEEGSEQGVPCPVPKQELADYHPDQCDSETVGPLWQWRDCASETGGTAGLDGKTELKWPVTVVGGESIIFDGVRVKVPPALAAEGVSAVRIGGVVTIGDQTFHLELRDATEQFTDEWVATLVVGENRETFPDVYGRHDLRVEWHATIEYGDDQSASLDAGETAQIVFVTPARPTRSTLIPFVSLFAFAMPDGVRATSAVALDERVWSAFMSLEFTRTRLNPSTGTLQSGTRLRYYRDWMLSDLLAFGFPNDRGGRHRFECEGGTHEEEALSEPVRFEGAGVARCDAFVRLLEATWGLLGTKSESVDLDDTSAWRALAARLPRTATFMLIRPQSWRFGALASILTPEALARLHAPLGYSHMVSFPPIPGLALAALGSPFGTVEQVAATEPIAQNTSEPPLIYRLGEFTLLEMDDVTYDPTFGQRYSSIAHWIATNVAGVASHTIGEEGKSDVDFCRPPLPCTLWVRPTTQ